MPALGLNFFFFLVKFRLILLHRETTFEKLTLILTETKDKLNEIFSAGRQPLQ